MGETLKVIIDKFINKEGKDDYIVSLFKRFFEFYNNYNKENGTKTLYESILNNSEKLFNIVETLEKQLKHYDGMRTDISHEIELGIEKTETEKIKLYNKYKETLIARRKIKNELELIAPLYQYTLNNILEIKKEYN